MSSCSVCTPTSLRRRGFRSVRRSTGAPCRLAAEAELKKAKERAFSMLSGREYTSSQLRDRLARHVDPEAAGQAVERMEELGLVDDDGYAERYARELSERKHYGLLRIRQGAGGRRAFPPSRLSGRFRCSTPTRRSRC